MYVDCNTNAAFNEMCPSDENECLFVFLLVEEEWDGGMEGKDLKKNDWMEGRK